MADWRKQATIPYIPVYRTVVPKRDYLPAHSDVLLGRVSKEGLIDLSKLKREMEKIFSLPGEHLDGLTAHRALILLNGKTGLVEIETAIQILGEELFYQVVWVLNLREDEVYFKEVESSRPLVNENDYGHWFDGFVRRLERYKVNPENADAFGQSVNKLYPRFQKLLAATANFGIWAGRFQETVRFLEPFVIFHKEGESYSFSDEFVPLYVNPNFPFEISAEWQRDPYVADGYQLLQGLKLCLQNNVEGTPHAYDPVLHDLASNVRLRVNLPSTIEMQEDTEATFNDLLQTNLQGLGYHVELSKEDIKDLEFWLRRRKWKRAHDTFEFYWDHKYNSLFLEAGKNDFDHTQYDFPITGRIILENMEWFENLYGYSLTPEIETRVHVRNENEPPGFSLIAPQSIEEGGVFCMEVIKLSDPEFDPVSIRWQQKGGSPVKLIKYNNGRKACAQAPVTKGVEIPYQFEVGVTDHPPSAYPVSKKTAVAEATVLHLPEVQLASGEPVELPEDVIRILTDPNKKDIASVAFTAGSHLYIFLRLPDGIENFEHALGASVAQGINVTGEDIKKAYSLRTWSYFVKIPGNVFAYMSVSPIRPWTRPGWVDFGENKSLVDLRDRRNPIRVRIPVQGLVEIQGNPNPTQIHLGKFGWEGEEQHFVLPLSIKNPIMKGKPDLVLPAELPVETFLASYISAGVVTLWSTSLAKQKTGDDYRLPLQLPEEWLPPVARAVLKLSVTNREGEEGKVVSEQILDPKYRPDGNASSFWDSLSIHIPDKIMPFPWIFAELNLSDPKWSKEFSQLLASDHRFTLTIKRRNEKGNMEETRFRVKGYKEWNWLKDSQTIIIPLVFSDPDARMAQSWIKHGGLLTGESSFYPNGLSWGVSIGWGEGPGGQSFLRFPSIPGYPEYPRPEFKNEPITPLALLAIFQAKIKDTVKKLTVETIESEINAGESFHLEIRLPEDPKEYRLKHLSAAVPLETALAVHLSDPNQESGVRYTLNATKVERHGHSWVFTYSTPSYLPRGKYRTMLQAQNMIAADYVVTHKIGTGEDLFQHSITTEVIRQDKSQGLKLVVFGKEGLEEPVGKGGLAK